MINVLHTAPILFTVNNKDNRTRSIKFVVANLLFKVGLPPSKKVGFICLNESPLKMMKNAFYFIVKDLFVLRIFKYFMTFLSCRKGLIRKSTLISKFMTPLTGKQITAIQILPNPISLEVWAIRL